MKKGLPFMLSLAMLATLFTGCGTDEVETAVKDGEVVSETVVVEDVDISCAWI